MIFVGIDWAEAHHDVCVLDHEGRVLINGRVPDGVEGVADAVCTAGADYGYVEPLSHYAGEVIRIDALRAAWASGACSTLAREHVTWDLRHSPATRMVTLANAFADQLDLDVSPDEVWKPNRGPGVNFEQYLRREALLKLSAPRRCS